MSATETRPPAAVPCLRRVRPFQPTTASPHVLDVVPERFHTQGSELIVKFVLEMLEKVGQEMVGDLKANLLWGGTRRVGTLCSGTDSPMIGYGAVQQAMNTLGQLVLRTRVRLRQEPHFTAFHQDPLEGQLDPPLR